MQREQVAQTAYGQNKPAGQLPIETQPGLRLASHPDGSFSASPNPNAGGYYSQSGHVLPEVLVTADRNGDWVFPDYLTQGILQPQWQEGGWQPRPGVINPDDIRALDDTLSRFSQQTRRFSQRYDDGVMGDDGQLSPSQAAAAAFAKGPLEILNNTAGGLADTARLFTSPEARSQTWQALSNPMDTAEAIWDSLQGLSGRDAGLLAVELATGGLVTRSVARLGGAGSLSEVPGGARAEIIAEANARSAYLAEKYGSLTPEQRMVRIDELTKPIIQNRLNVDLSNQQYVFRAIEAGDLTYYEHGISGPLGRPAYFSLEGGETLAEHMAGAQMKTTPDILLRIPVSEIKNPTVARPYGYTPESMRPTQHGWEYKVNSYPAYGQGGYHQLLGTTDRFDSSWIYKDWRNQ